MRHPDMGKVTVTQVLLSIVGALVPVLIVVVLITGHMMHIFATFGKPDAAGSDAATLARIKPVGEFAVVSADAAAAAPAEGAAIDGKKVYSGLCFSCHDSGAAGAPKLGDKAAWGPRIGQGKETLYKHAIGGFQGKSGSMPAKGGNASLSDDEVKAAVDYMVSQGK